MQNVAIFPQTNFIALKNNSLSFWGTNKLWHMTFKDISTTGYIYQNSGEHNYDFWDCEFGKQNFKSKFYFTLFNRNGFPFLPPLNYIIFTVHFFKSFSSNILNHNIYELHIWVMVWWRVLNKQIKEVEIIIFPQDLPQLNTPKTKTLYILSSCHIHDIGLFPCFVWAVQYAC